MWIDVEFAQRITRRDVGARPEATHADTFAAQLFNALDLWLGVQRKDHLVDVVAEYFQVGAVERCRDPALARLLLRIKKAASVE